jgi:hypothetical protein
VCHDHSAATVPLATKLIHSITLQKVLAKQLNSKEKLGKWRVKLTHPEYPHQVAVNNVPKDHRQPGQKSVSNSKQLVKRIKFTLPQEKHRTGIIIGSNCVLMSFLRRSRKMQRI